MSIFVLAPAARSDVEEIWSYYAVEVDDVDLADRMREEIFRGIRRVARTPGVGHLRSDLADEPLRFWAVRKYLIIYRTEARPVQIVRILHSARDVQSILKDEK